MHLINVRLDATRARKDFLPKFKEPIVNRTTPSTLSIKQSLKVIDNQLKEKPIFHKTASTLSTKPRISLTKIEIANETQHIDPASGNIIYINKITNQRSAQPTSIIIDTHEELEKAILTRNQKHFRQDKNTPWHQPPLNQINSLIFFDLLQVTDNDLRSIRVFPETCMILAILQDEYRKDHPKWSPIITFDEFILGLLHWDEKTTNPPSGGHLGIYKALVTAYINAGGKFTSKKDSNAFSIKDKDRAILNVIHGLASLAYIHGFYLKQWEQGIEIMIDKKTGKHSARNVTYYASL